jgi:hypothetical protein
VLAGWFNVHCPAKERRSNSTGQSMNHHIKEKKMKKKPDNDYLCFIINEIKTGVKVTPGKPAIIHCYETSYEIVPGRNHEQAVG